MKQLHWAPEVIVILFDIFLITGTVEWSESIHAGYI